MSASFATKSAEYRVEQIVLPSNRTGTLIPDDLRVKLPERIRALASGEDMIDDKVIGNAIAFCTNCLPIVKVPDSVYVDEGDVVLFWKTGERGSILVIIDAAYLHYFIRQEDSTEIHDSDIEIDVKAGYALRPYLPPHPSRQNKDVSNRRNS